MLKFLFIIVFIIPLCFLKKIFWTVQNILFIIIFLFILFLGFRNFWVNLSFFLGNDLISYGLIILSVWICALILISSEGLYKVKNYYSYFSFLILLLLFLLLLTFRTIRIFLFYLFFERSLIPTLFLILGWGYQPERLQAGLYLLFYTLLASLPLLVSIFFIFNVHSTITIFLIVNFSFHNQLHFLHRSDSLKFGDSSGRWKQTHEISHGLHDSGISYHRIDLHKSFLADCAVFWCFEKLEASIIERLVN